MDQTYVLLRSSKRDLERWATVAWSIWNARNKVYFERKQTHRRTILSGAESILDEYQKLMARVS